MRMLFSIAKQIFFAILLLNTTECAFALSKSQLKSLQESINEMCVTPDRKGDIIKAEGEIKAGTKIPIKIVDGQISGQLQYESWNGISITLDKYKTDPRQCAVEMMKLLLPAFASGPSIQSELMAYRLGTNSAWLSHWRTESAATNVPTDITAMVKQHEETLITLASSLGLSETQAILQFDFKSSVLGDYTDSSAITTLAQLIEAKAGKDAAIAYKTGVKIEAAYWHATGGNFSPFPMDPFSAENTLSNLNELAIALGAQPVPMYDFLSGDNATANQKMKLLSKKLNQNVEVALSE